MFLVFSISYFLWLLVVKSLILRGFNFGVGLEFDRKDFFGGGAGSHLCTALLTTQIFTLKIEKSKTVV